MSCGATIMSAPISRNHSLSIFSLVPDELLDSCSGDERTARKREWLAGLGLLSAAPADEAELDAACERAGLRSAMEMGLGRSGASRRVRKSWRKAPAAGRSL